MATLREYTVVVNGHETVMNLSEEDAKRLGGKPTSGGRSGAPDEPDEKSARAANKSRTASNKSRE